MAADLTVNTTGSVTPISAVGGSKVIESAAVADMTAQVALLETMVSDGLFRKAPMLMTVFTPAGTVTAVARAGEDVEVAEAVADEVEAPTTVTRTVTVYVAPVVADSTVNTTGMVKPIKAAEGSKVIEPAAVAEITAKVALLDTITSDGLLR